MVPIDALPATSEYGPDKFIGPVTMAPADMLPAVSGLVDIFSELDTMVPTDKLPAVKGLTPALSPTLYAIAPVVMLEVTNVYAKTLPEVIVPEDK